MWAYKLEGACIPIIDWKGYKVWNANSVTQGNNLLFNFTILTVWEIHSLVDFKSDSLTYEIALHLGEFASFRRQDWSNTLWFPGYGAVGLSPSYSLQAGSLVWVCNNFWQQSSHPMRGMGRGKVSLHTSFWFLNTSCLLMKQQSNCLSNDPGKVDSNFFCYVATVLSPNRNVLESKQQAEAKRKAFNDWTGEV